MIAWKYRADVSFFKAVGIHCNLFGHRFQVEFHQLPGPDTTKTRHPHQWAFVSFILWGGYTEEFEDVDKPVVQRTWKLWSIHRFPKDAKHKVVAVKPNTKTLWVAYNKLPRR